MTAQRETKNQGRFAGIFIRGGTVESDEELGKGLKHPVRIYKKLPDFPEKYGLLKGDWVETIECKDVYKKYAQADYDIDAEFVAFDEDNMKWFLIKKEKE